MKIIRFFQAIVFLCAIAPIAAMADDTVMQRLCTAPDLTGTFQLTDLKENPAGQESDWYKDFPYHYLVFNTGNKYEYVASRHAMTKSEDLQKALIMSESEGNLPISRRYTLDTNGLLNLYINDNMDNSYRCMIATKANGGAREGDVILVGYSKNRSELHKVFRRWTK